MKQIEQENNSAKKKSTTQASKAKFVIPEISGTIEQIKEEEEQEEAGLMHLLFAALLGGAIKKKKASQDAADIRLEIEMQELHQEKSEGLSKCGCF